MNVRILLIAVACTSPMVFAQTLSSVKVEPAKIKAGEAAKITADFEVSGGINCGLKLHFGDGSDASYKINQDKDVPLVVTHTYAKPGRYEIKAEPKRNEMVLGCMGKNQTTMLDVVGAADASTAAKTKAVQCPEGWKLDAKSVNKAGAYLCRAKAGTPAPASKLSCPGDLGYYENTKKGELGCK